MASVTVNGEAATLNGNNWEKEVPLFDGQNDFVVVVTDNSGNSTTKTITITK